MRTWSMPFSRTTYTESSPHVSSPWNRHFPIRKSPYRACEKEVNVAQFRPEYSTSPWTIVLWFGERNAVETRVFKPRFPTRGVRVW